MDYNIREMRRIIVSIVIAGALCLSACTSAREDASLVTISTEETIKQESSSSAETGAESTASAETSAEALAEVTSFPLVYDGLDTGIEILLEDCICEYDRDDRKVYSYYVSDAAVGAEGYALFVQTPEDTMKVFPVKDYLVDGDEQKLYMLWGNDSFERIQGIDFAESPAGYKIASVSSMEELIGEAYGLELLEDGTDFEDLQVEFVEIREDETKVLCGSATAIYGSSGQEYEIAWEIDTQTCVESAKAYLDSMDIHPLYVAFLRNEISVTNPFVQGDTDNPFAELSYFDDEKYAPEDTFSNARKSFALVDIDNEGEPELLFRMEDSPSESICIFAVRDEELICYDICETHTTHMGFSVYNNGYIRSGQNYDGNEEMIYTFGSGGKYFELIHFVKAADSQSELEYDYYYFDGNESETYSLQSNEEYENMMEGYKGETPKWYDCELFADVAQ